MKRYCGQFLLGHAQFTQRAAQAGRFAVDGRRVVTFVEMMDTDMEGSQDEVHRRLERWGVIRALRRAGAVDGDVVVFGEAEWRLEE